MTYPCVYLAGPADTLEAAQGQKHELISRKLRLATGERLLDIGCGWGSKLIHAAARHGVRRVGVTLLEPQAALARMSIRAAGLAHLVEIRVPDYREIRDGPFDKTLTIGVYGHVGRSELRRFTASCVGCCSPEVYSSTTGSQGSAHSPDAVTREPRATSLRQGSFIQSPISLTRSDYGSPRRRVLRKHYPLTLRRWAANLQAHRFEATAIAGRQCERAWRLYLLGTAQAFEAGEITVHRKWQLGRARRMVFRCNLAQPSMGRIG